MENIVKAYYVSVVIPAKNEEKRLPAFLHRLAELCRNSSNKYEIIIVDDGSEDNTFSVSRSFENQFSSLKVIRLNRNRGKGGAVKCGFFRAKGDICVFMDADGSTPASEIEKNLQHFQGGYGIVIGSRVLKGTDSRVQAKSYRRWMGQVFNTSVQKLLLDEFKDTQCGFKMFRKEVIRPIFSKLRLKGFGFDIELLYIASRLGIPVKEVPVNWHHVDGSKVNLLTDSFKMFLNVLQIRRWHKNIQPCVNSLPESGLNHSVT